MWLVMDVIKIRDVYVRERERERISYHEDC